MQVKVAVVHDDVFEVDEHPVERLSRPTLGPLIRCTVVVERVVDGLMLIYYKSRRSQTLQRATQE